MSVKTQISNNEFEFNISGEVDVAVGAAAPTAVRCSNASVARTAVGTIVVTVQNPNKLKLVELLERSVCFAGAAPTAALGCRILSVTQSSVDDSFIITIKLTATSGGSGADTDAGTAVTVSFTVKVRTNKLGNPL